ALAGQTAGEQPAVRSSPLHVSERPSGLRGDERGQGAQLVRVISLQTDRQAIPKDIPLTRAFYNELLPGVSAEHGQRSVAIKPGPFVAEDPFPYGEEVGAGMPLFSAERLPEETRNNAHHKQPFPARNGDLVPVRTLRAPDRSQADGKDDDQPPEPDI